MATPIPVETPVRPPTPQPRLHWNRVVLGILLAAAGIAWLLDTLGYDVAWNLAPAVGLVVVGSALLTSLAGGTGRGGLVAMGLALLVAALAVGVGFGRFAGPAGEVVLRPSATAWPADRTLSAGKVTLDLTTQPLPATGHVTVAVGAGEVEVRVPAGVGVEASTVVGTITVDGRPVAQVVDQRFTDRATAPVVVTVEVGAGEVRVSHVQP